MKRLTAEQTSDFSRRSSYIISNYTDRHSKLPVCHIANNMDPSRTDSSGAVRPGPIVFAFDIKGEDKMAVYSATKEPPGTQASNLRHFIETVQMSIKNQCVQHNMECA